MSEQNMKLIALAAKAIRLEIHESDDGTMQRRPVWCVTNYVNGQPYGESRYDPLNYDADAFRLALRLNMLIDPLDFTGMTRVMARKPDSIWCEEIWDGDRYAATRRAIVRAAAEIGKSMP